MTKKLYRPVGLTELKLVMQTEWTRFPPRLEWQPIFYPVLNRDYATRIAKEWNTEDAFGGYCGVVTEFDIRKERYDRYEVQNVGGEGIDELWVPSAELDAFNEDIVGEIRVVDAFFGQGFQMPENAKLGEILKRFI